MQKSGFSDNGETDQVKIIFSLQEALILIPQTESSVTFAIFYFFGHFLANFRVFFWCFWHFLAIFGVFCLPKHNFSTYVKQISFLRAEMNLVPLKTPK